MIHRQCPWLHATWMKLQLSRCTSDIPTPSSESQTTDTLSRFHSMSDVALLGERPLRIKHRAYLNYDMFFPAIPALWVRAKLTGPAADQGYTIPCQASTWHTVNGLDIRIMGIRLAQFYCSLCDKFPSPTLYTNTVYKLYILTCPAVLLTRGQAPQANSFYNFTWPHTTAQMRHCTTWYSHSLQSRAHNSHSDISKHTFLMRTLPCRQFAFFTVNSIILSHLYSNRNMPWHPLHVYHSGTTWELKQKRKKVNSRDDNIREWSGCSLSVYMKLSMPWWFLLIPV